MIIRASIYFLNYAEGGRISPPASGYHPQLKIGEMMTSCIIQSEDPKINIFDFGKTHAVLLRLMFEKNVEASLGKSLCDIFHPDYMIELYEGNRKIGEGLVTKVEI